jgi:hypothetical protein
LRESPRASKMLAHANHVEFSILGEDQNGDFRLKCSQLPSFFVYYLGRLYKYNVIKQTLIINLIIYRIKKANRREFSIYGIGLLRNSLLTKKLEKM